MATKKTKAIGKRKCLNPHCDAEVVVREGEGGALNASCQICDLTAYGKAGTQAKRDILADMVPLKRETVEAGAAAAAPEEQPVQPPRRSNFLGMGGAT